MSLPDPAVPPQDDLLAICHCDPTYLQHVGGRFDPARPEPLLQYFELSQFFDPASVRGKLAMQNRYQHHSVALALDASTMAGINYGVTFADGAHQRFHIHKFYQHGNGRFTPMAGYYLHNGAIYQAPDLYELLASRLTASLVHLRSAYETLLGLTSFHPARGLAWQEPSDGAAGSLGLGGGEPARRGTATRQSGTVASRSVRGGGPAAAKQQNPPKKLEGHLARTFHARVTALISRAAEQEHVQLEPLPDLADTETQGDKHAPATAEATPEPSALLGRKRKTKRERDSDAGSMGGESTMSRKKKRLNKRRERPSESAPPGQ